MKTTTFINKYEFFISLNNISLVYKDFQIIIDELIIRIIFLFILLIKVHLTLLVYRFGMI